MRPSPTAAERPLDALNFFLADVRDGLGPYLAIYLLTVQHWDAARIGIVMSVGGIAGIIAQTPAGALVDASRAKRALIVGAAVLVAASCLVLPLLPTFLPVAATQAVAGAAGSIFQPAIAAVTLGIVGRHTFTRRTGRNEAWNHAGNAVAAILAGAGAFAFGPIVVFWLLGGMALASIVATLRVPAAAIDHAQARGLDADGDEAGAGPGAISVLLSCRPLLIFAVCVVLFHFANAAMLPLVGQKLALADPKLGTTLMSVCIVAAQIVMVPSAMLVGWKADSLGRKPLFCLGFVVLLLRGVLYTFSDSPIWLVAIQSLDGVGAGIFGAIFPLVVADLTRGTGHFNVSLGAITAALGTGAALSTTVAGFIVVKAGYSAAFLTLAGVALAGVAVFVLFMPETAPRAAAVPADTIQGSTRRKPDHEAA